MRQPCYPAPFYVVTPSALGSGSAGGDQKGGLLDAVNGVRAAPPNKRITLWFEAEARVGQKGRICHRWWTRGRRPPGLCDLRYTWVHLFAAFRPATGDRFALVMPVVSTEAMNIFLHGFSSRLADDEHVVMVLDQAGWHRANGLRIPGNVTLVPLPPYSPELNPVERLWLYLRERHLSLRQLDDYDQIVDARCHGRNILTPGTYPFLVCVSIHQTSQRESSTALCGMSFQNQQRETANRSYGLGACPPPFGHRPERPTANFLATSGVFLQPPLYSCTKAE
jgi:transposase